MLAHAAAFACVKPVYFHVRFRARPGLQPGLEGRSPLLADGALAKPWKAGFCDNWTVLTDKLFFCANCAPKIFKLLFFQAIFCHKNARRT